MTNSELPTAEELSATLVDVLSTVLAQEAVETTESMGEGPFAVARLGIHCEADDHFAQIELEVGIHLARVLASKMMLMADPTQDDVVDAVAELGNIVAGSTKSLLYNHARLSLPSSEIVGQVSADALSPSAGRPQVRAIVLGHVVQLTVVPDADPAGLVWPPIVSDELSGRL